MGNSLVTGEFPALRPVTRSFDVSFDLRLNKRFSKQWWGWWVETPSRPLWRHCNDTGQTSHNLEWLSSTKGAYSNKGYCLLIAVRCSCLRWQMGFWSQNNIMNTYNTFCWLKNVVFWSKKFIEIADSPVGNKYALLAGFSMFSEYHLKLLMHRGLGLFQYKDVILPVHESLFGDKVLFLHNGNSYTYDTAY